MAWQIEYLPEEKAARIVCTGQTKQGDAIAQTDAAIELQSKYNVRRFLLDYSGIEIVAAPLADIYGLPDYYHKRGVPRDIRIAVVVPAHHFQRDKFEFYEDVCLNRGYSSRMFESLKEAWSWLKEESG
ncbi:MAG TPA: hypothetical protein VF117_07925 [Gammaproteobacteria bacterium]